MALRLGRNDQRRLVVFLAAVVGGVFAAGPTDVTILDRVSSAVFAGVLAAAGATASPLLLLGAGAGAALVAADTLGVAFAGGAVLLAAVAAGQVRPLSRLCAASSGLAGVSLLQREPDPAVLTYVVPFVIAAVLVVAALGVMPRRRRRRTAWIVGGAAVVLVGLAAIGGLAGLRAYRDADDGIDALRAARVAATAGDLEGATDAFRAAEQAFRRAADPLGSYGRFGRAVPGLSQQLAAARTAAETAADAAGAMRSVSAELRLDDVALQGGRVDIAAVADAEQPLSTAVDALVVALRRLSSIDRGPLLPPVRDALDDALDEAVAAATTAERAHRAVQELPGLLGGDRPTRYLVLFTSPVEARNRFGFPGAYAVLAAEGGRLRFERAGPLPEIAPTGGSFDQALLDVPARAEPYQFYGVSRDWRSTTLPSHGPAVTELAIQMGAQAGLGALDGLILADPQALAAFVGLLGDVPVPGLDVVLTEDTTVEFLLQRQYLEFPELGQQSDRKDALADVAVAMGERLEVLSVSKVRDLVDRFGALIEAGHLVVGVPASADPGAADLLGDLGLDGAFPRDDDADVLYVGQRNNVGNKIDVFLERALRYEATIDDDGALSATLTIDLANQAPASGLPEYLIGSALDDPPPRGTNRTTAMIYSRHELVDVTLDGVPVTPTVLYDGGLLVYQVGLDLGPGERRSIVARFEGIATEGPYALVVHPTALPAPDRVAVQISDARDGGGTQALDAEVTTPTCLAVGDAGCRHARRP